MTGASMAWLAIGCFLVSSGADLNHKNHASKSPIDEVADSRIREVLQKYVKYVLAPSLLHIFRYEPIAFAENSASVHVKFQFC